MPFTSPLLLHPTARRLFLTLSIPAVLASGAAMSTAATKPADPPSASASDVANTPFLTRTYTPRHRTFPYTARDFLRADESSDTNFYSTPRFVTHIDDNAIDLLRRYYDATLPRQGRILDLCSSWISHFPPSLSTAAEATRKDRQDGNRKMDAENAGGLSVVGLGMSAAELTANPILSHTILQDLNMDPTIPHSSAPLDATVCVVSVDYLTKPIEVLTSLRDRTTDGGSVHLVISNRCFPTKAVGRWLRVSEQERLQMVGDYLWHSGWRGIEIVELSDGRGKASGLTGMLGGGVDPLWVVRGVKSGEEEEEEGRSEL